MQKYVGVYELYSNDKGFDWVPYFFKERMKNTWFLVFSTKEKNH